MLKYKNKLIASKIIYCDNIFMKGTGLILHSKRSVDDTAWWFRFKKPEQVTITMFLVFFPIDVIFLDNNNRVIELKENFRPFQNYISTTKIWSFVELKDGTIKKYGIKKGHTLKF